ncbi:hypothetical protein M9H77_02143 [Catharanthus roseus]|uniref:Uncharacterized protein n=1 Tax=Catharanthus roseus TaxID=4058 RepID=A0ACC0C7M3_CATRO|nr:hypothetical protein M9H77_02143 [Catharanthus roseus]
MLSRLRRELSEVISHYPHYNHNDIKVTFILVHLGLAAWYCHREKVWFMTFSTLLHTYLKLFEAYSLYTLYYVRFFSVTHPLQVSNSFQWDHPPLPIYGQVSRRPILKRLHREFSGFICHRTDFYRNSSNVTSIFVRLGYAV